MPYRKEQFVNNEIYHIVIKGIDDNLLFKDTDDNYRAIFSIYEFNNANPVVIRERRKERSKIKTQIKKAEQDFLKEVNRGPTSVDLRDKLVEILAFCIMPNHFHLLLRQIKDRGIIRFMIKLNTGYGGYFNRKYGRQGPLLLRRFTAVHIKTDEQLKTVFVYIHANPISFTEPKWKEFGINNPNRVIKFLEEEYRWSSYFDYLGKKNFPSLTERKFLLKIMGDEQGCRDFIENWVKYKGEIKKFAKLALE